MDLRRRIGREEHVLVPLLRSPTIYEEELLVAFGMAGCVSIEVSMITSMTFVLIHDTSTLFQRSDVCILAQSLVG